MRGLGAGRGQREEAAACAMAGGPPKALLSSGPHSLRDMPHPLAGSSSEEAVGGDSTPSPDLLVARSFGDKVGRPGLGTGRLLSPGGGRVLDPEPREAGRRAHPGGYSRGTDAPSPPERSAKASLLCGPRGVAAQGSGPGTAVSGCDWLRARG